MSKFWYICLEKKVGDEKKFVVLEQLGKKLTPIKSKKGMERVSHWCSIYNVRNIRILDDIHFAVQVETFLDDEGV